MKYSCSYGTVRVCGTGHKQAAPEAGMKRAGKSFFPALLNLPGMYFMGKAGVSKR